MTQLPLDLAASVPPAPPQFRGDTYVPRLDERRLTRQIERIRDYMLAQRGAYRTLQEIRIATGAGEASASAQLRNLESPKQNPWHLSYRKDRRRRGDPNGGCWEYQILPPEEP